MSNFSVVATPLEGVKLVQGRRFSDDRGYFSETWSSHALRDLGVAETFVQDNQSLSTRPGTLRGLHFQTPPFEQAKLVRVVAGRIWDVAVDLKRSSPTFGRWFGIELSADNDRQLLVPAGFGHGFLTLEPRTIVAYKVSSPYSAAHDAGVAWNDPDLSVDWPLPSGLGTPWLSTKDQALPPVQAAFTFD